MSDIPFIPGFTGNPIAAPATPSTAASTTVPAAIAVLPVGSLLQATIENFDKNGNFLLQTKNGQLLINSQLNLEEGSQVILKILANNPNQQQAASIFQAKIVSVDGKPVTPALIAQPQPQQPTEQPAALNSTVNSARQPVITEDFDLIKLAQPQVQNKAGNQVVNTPPIQTVEEAPAIINLIRGQTINAAIISPAPDAAKIIQKVLPQQPIGQPVQQPSLLDIIQGVPAQQPVQINIKPADILNIKIISVELPAQEIPPPIQISNIQQQDKQTLQIQNPQEQNIPALRVPAITSTPQGQNLVAATVIGTEKSGEVVVKTAIGTIKLPSEIALPKGATVQIELVSVNSQNKPELPSQINEEVSLLTSNRKTVEGIIGALRNAAPEILEKVIKNVVPEPDRTFTPKLFTYLKNIISVPQNDQNSLLQTDVRKVLQQEGRTDLIRNFSNETASFRQISQDNPSNWNSLTFPVYDGRELQYGNVYYRQYKNKGKRSNETNAARFVFEIDTSFLGFFQIDGFIRGQRSKKELDLQIRTKNPVEAEMQKEINEIFRQTSEAVGISSTLQFHVTQQFPTFPFDLEEDGDSIIV